MGRYALCKNDFFKILKQVPVIENMYLHKYVNHYLPIFAGNLEPRNNPILIGKCNGNQGFRGEMERVRILYHCIKITCLM